MNGQHTGPLLRVRHLRNRVDLSQRILVFAEKHPDAVELFLDGGAILGVRRKVEEHRRHRLRIDQEAVVSDVAVRPLGPVTVVARE